MIKKTNNRREKECFIHIKSMSKLWNQTHNDHVPHGNGEQKARRRSDSYGIKPPFKLILESKDE